MVSALMALAGKEHVKDGEKNGVLSVSNALLTSFLLLCK